MPWKKTRFSDKFIQILQAIQSQVDMNNQNKESKEEYIYSIIHNLIFSQAWKRTHPMCLLRRRIVSSLEIFCTTF